MLLRRFTGHLKEQNWFAVSLDMLVVVIGLLVGLQINDWHAGKRDEAEGIYHVKSLLSDIENDIAAYDELIATSAERLDDTFAASRILIKAETAEEDSEQFQQKHYAAFYLWGPKKKPAVLSRIVDGGKLDLIPSRDLQLALINFDNAYDEFIYQTNTSYGYSKDITLVLMNQIEYGERGMKSSLEDLRANKQVVAAMRGKAIMQRIQLDTLRQVQEANKILQKKLDTYLKRQT